MKICIFKFFNLITYNNFMNQNYFYFKNYYFTIILCLKNFFTVQFTKIVRLLLTIIKIFHCYYFIITINFLYYSKFFRYLLYFQLNLLHQFHQNFNLNKSHYFNF
ncbi:hypothetical protein PPERSA_09836 [Pseudocohnilembus persalinus]|uniref:Transmembrane protein n=1 Tax=Pseudocohnilembus persalinus TaxID=266149 RepID=A0A0V0QUP3_PSEPJ|nr:hypothetical protein PPERSA_09836 [Pseudocohnilembus persalinus]|eukprot:KRX05696.1 hypothetical protein PPERSA_09836 [Pseudocohnilembus persalinus]